MFIDPSAAAAPRRFADPLDCLLAAHVEQRALCDALEEFCADPDRWRQAVQAAALHARLTHELALHAADESDDLLPMLCRRGIIGDDSAAVAMADSQHARDQRLLAMLFPELARLAGGEPPANAVALTTRGIAFAHTYRKHLEFEEEAVLAPATALDAGDRRAVLAAMTVRRRMWS